MGKRVSVQLIAGSLLSICGVTAGAQSRPSPAPVEISTGWQLQDSAKVPEAGATISTSGYQPTGWMAARCLEPC
ncbi:MAG: hypothetical protein WBX06_02760 [Acidobacteriaceae bacterium]